MKIITYRIEKKILATDRWFSIDKLWHLLICMAISAVCGYPTALLVGVIKETSDIGGSGFSYKDLTADIIGAAIGHIIRIL